jgi:hypothetical protein
LPQFYDQAIDDTLLALEAVVGLDKQVVGNASGDGGRQLLAVVEGFDCSCPQHLVPRLTEEQVRAAVHHFQKSIVLLETILANPD